MASDLNKDVELENSTVAETEAEASEISQEVENEAGEATEAAEVEEIDYKADFKAKIIVVTSGKGGVGKTTSSASISSGLALLGKKTAVIDFDVGLRNLDLVMGCERRVVYDLVNVIKKEATLRQALIKDKNCPNLYILPASQTRDKDALSKEGVHRILRELDDMGFEYIICDSPAGIETGALMALYFADIAIVTTNPEVSSVRDSDRIIGILDSKSRRAEYGLEPIKPYLLLTRYDPNRVDGGHMLSMDEVIELLSIELIGVIPESKSVLEASNLGKPTVYIKGSDAGMAYMDTVKRILGQHVDFRFTQKVGIFKRLLGKK
ncbi:MAG: septum site-determining protein MinD [Ruminobacter sp.]|uniref:septum site-determining protein MinD n=1 Tax=Ruminobacter sp. TaxID=2774296 RepID=UPI00257C3B1D|nr:septum site-determining protein MinD [Ruminobacter sp.]MBQ3775672.1 septum site-determining protein MinD [Ruminobacter sp.]